MPRHLFQDVDRRFAGTAAAVFMITLLGYLALTRSGLIAVDRVAVLDSLAARALAVGIGAALIIGAAGGRLGDPSRAYTRVARILLIAAFLFAFHRVASESPLFEGDAGEYLLMTTSVALHGTPDLRSGDLERFNRERIDQSLPITDPQYGYVRSKANGRTYSYHFWAYSALAAPMWIALDMVGITPLKAHSILNLVLFFWALGLILTYADMPPMKRATAAILLCFSPLLWYVRWPSPELYSASLVIMGIVAFSRRRFAVATLCASLASFQNPPLLLLAAALAGQALLGPNRVKDYPRRMQIVASGTLGLIPLAFYQALYGTPNLISALGFSDRSFMTVQRFVSFFSDLNQGVAVYAVAVTATALVAFVLAAVRHHGLALWLGLTVAVIVAAVTTTIDWNNNSAGMMRYAVWIYPLLVWIAVDFGSQHKFSQSVLPVLATLQFANCLLFFSIVTGYQHNVIAREVLWRAPALYNPVPEVFAERAFEDQLPIDPYLPVAFEREGAVTKVLVDSAATERFDASFRTKKGFSLPPSKPAGLPGLRYIDFSPGTVFIKGQETVATGGASVTKTLVGGPSQYGSVADLFNVYPRDEQERPLLSPLAIYPLYVEVWHRGGDLRLPGGSRPLAVLVEVIASDGAVLSSSREPLRGPWCPDEKATFYAAFRTPQRPGVYRVRVSLVQLVSGGVRVIDRHEEEAAIMVQMAPPIR